MPYLVLHYNFQRLFFLSSRDIALKIPYSTFECTDFFLSSRSKLSKIIGPGPNSNFVVSRGLIHVYAVLTLYYYTSLPNLESGKRKY